jgi:hypothetical protein
MRRFPYLAVFLSLLIGQALTILAVAVYSLS